METRWLYTTSENFPALVKESKEVCLIPMGCVEKHGLHLPLGSDIIEASTITYAASRLETACVFPDFTFGDVPGGPASPAGSISVPVEMEMALLETLCEQIARNGFKKILICNAHGGNKSWLSAFLRNLMNKKHDFVCAVTTLPFSTTHKILAEQLLQNGRGSMPELTAEDEDYLLDFYRQGKESGHACISETALIMAVAPEAVHLDRLGIESGLSTHQADYLKEAGIEIVSGGWDINYPNAYHGHDPVDCTENIGRAALRVAAEQLARTVKAFKEDENLLRWHANFQKGW
ncbi:MAG: creatininase family protein [Clostridia bacterium]|nr:creatininase family protein [Clostridia bacterium]